MTASTAVDVVLALPGRTWRVALDWRAGMTVAAAVRASGLADVCAREAGEPPTLGVFGRKVGGDHVLAPGDRVELYRALTVDPRARRRARAGTRGE